MSDFIKDVVYRQRRTFKKSFSKGKTCHCTSIAKRICEQKLQSSLIKSFSEKLINMVQFVDVAQLDHAVIVQFSGVARSRYISTCVKGGVMNSDFELN